MPLIARSIDIALRRSNRSDETEEWLIWPSSGNCKNYAKRHELLALGWPSRALLGCRPANITSFSSYV